jgi:hypothetical protein
LRYGADCTRSNLRQSARNLPGAVADFYTTGMRWSYWAIAAMALAAVLVSFVFTNGWTVWPFMFCAGVMFMIHEAAERNGEGVPPLHVYGLVIGLLAVFVVIVVLLSLLNPVVLLLGIAIIGYQCARAFVQEQRRDHLVESRRREGLCVFCGEAASGSVGICEHCGNEPDPTGQRLRRVASIVGGRKNAAHTRAVLTRDSAATSASRKEKALIARHPRPRAPK